MTFTDTDLTDKARDHLSFAAHWHSLANETDAGRERSTQRGIAKEAEAKAIGVLSLLPNRRELYRTLRDEIYTERGLSITGFGSAR